MAVLSESLGFGSDGLQIVGTEVPLPGGGYHADILCRLTGSPDGDLVLIENQFGKSNHDHLGKLLTYASGLKARTVVLIGELIREEHRAALDWLNAITGEEHSFFACEMELWRIGDSLPAPRFSVVVQPNDWTRVAEAQGKNLANGNLSDTRSLQRAYWEAFESGLANLRGRVRAVKPQPQNWLVHGLGRTGATLNTTVHFWENRLRAGVYLNGPTAETFFRQLLSKKAEIEGEFGEPLIWYDDSSKERQIFLQRSFPDLRDQTSWLAQHQWLAETMERLHRVFQDRVRALSIVDGADAP